MLKLKLQYVQQTVVQHPLSLTAPQAGDPRSHQGHHEEGSHVSPDAQRPGLTGHGFPLTLLTVPAVSLYLTAHCPLHPGRQGVHGEAGRNCEELWEPDTFVLSGLARQAQASLPLDAPGALSAGQCSLGSPPLSDTLYHGS